MSLCLVQYRAKLGWRSPVGVTTAELSAADETHIHILQSHRKSALLGGTETKTCAVC